MSGTYDGWYSEFVFLAIVEELQDIISNDDSGLAAENVLDTHDCNL